MQPLIKVENLQKSFGKYQIVNNCSLEIGPGTVYGLVGMNGAGKTTLLRLLLGILKPDSGTISISGFIPWKHQSEFYRQCGVVLENDGFWGNLTAKENCKVYAAAKGISNATMSSYLDEYWKESALFKGQKKVKTLSRGQRMQCALCRAFMGEPSFFFLDEPVIALDLTAGGHFKKLVHEAKARGASLIISSHQFDAIDDLCDRVGILRDGKILDITAKSTDTRTEECFIDTDSGQKAVEIITKHGGNNLFFDGGFHFSLEDFNNTTPVIIKELVGAGCKIREVRKVENTFSKTIRMFYSSSGENKP